MFLRPILFSIKLFSAILFACLLFSGSSMAGSTELGQLVIKNFQQKEYLASAQNFAIVQDKRGIMYFGNNGGVLEYDGENWRLINVTNKTTVRSLAIGNDGFVYVGAQKEIGYLSPDSSGKLVYISLLEKVNEKERDFDDVWKTWATPDGIYFQTTARIFFWNGSEMRSWRPETACRRSFLIGEKLYVQHVGMGIASLDKDKFTLIQGTERFAKVTIQDMVAYQKNSMLILTKNEGLFLLEITGKAKGEVKPFKTTIDDFLISHLTNCLYKLNDSLFSIGMWGDGAVIINSHGELIRTLNKEIGLEDGIVHSQYLDKDGMLWLALSVGISRVEIHSPLTYFDNKSGLEGTVEAITRFYGRVYAASQTGLYYLSASEDIERDIKEKKLAPLSHYAASFKPVKDISLACWFMLPYVNGNDSALVVALDDGIYEISKNNTKILIVKCVPYELHQSKSDPARVFVGLDEGMMSIYRLGGGWIKEGKIKDFKANVFKMSEKENGIIWMGTINQGLYKMTVKESGKKFTTEIARYDTSSGLPSGAIYPQLTTQGVIFGTGEGIFSMNGEGKFSPVREIMQLFPEGKRGIHRIKEDYKGRIWMITYLGNTFETGYLEKNGEVYQWTSTPFKPISKSIVHAILHESGFVTWLGGADGVSRFEGYKDKNYRPQYNTQIRKVVLGEDSILYWGSYRNENGSLGLVQPEIFKQVLPYSLNSVTFEFAAQMYENESQKQYSYYLEGFDKEWSMWKIETKAVYTNLPEGDYRFRVKSVNIYGNESTEAVYEFTILPPWSRTMWAYAGYLILFIAFVYGAVNLSTRRLQAIIRERTQEIVHQKEEIEKQKEVVEEKQKEIIDSINYAKRIQSAILAREEDIKQIYPDSFLLYKPKDIVAGDFYFFETTPTHVFYAAADCTGHGVPGALVSVVCSNALNRCVKEFGLTDPGQILDKTRELVVETFKKSGQEVKDGMDISLLVKELEKNIYSWAGANNPLWLIQTNPENNEVELLEIKANKQPIGLSEKPAPFTSHNLLLRKGDAVCLFTDGYADQFGGPEGKKFKYKPFKELLKNVYKISSSEQKVVLDTTIEEWKKGFEQIDDICVIGIRV